MGKSTKKKHTRKIHRAGGGRWKDRWRKSERKEPQAEPVEPEEEMEEEMAPPVESVDDGVPGQNIDPYQVLTKIHRGNYHGAPLYQESNQEKAVKLKKQEAQARQAVLERKHSGNDALIEKLRKEQAALKVSPEGIALAQQSRLDMEHRHKERRKLRFKQIAAATAAVGVLGAAAVTSPVGPAVVGLAGTKTAGVTGFGAAVIAKDKLEERWGRWKRGKNRRNLTKFARQHQKGEDALTSLIQKEKRRLSIMRQKIPDLTEQANQAQLDDMWFKEATRSLQHKTAAVEDLRVKKLQEVQELKRVKEMQRAVRKGQVDKSTLDEYGKKNEEAAEMGSYYRTRRDHGREEPGGYDDDREARRQQGMERTRAVTAAEAEDPESIPDDKFSSEPVKAVEAVEAVEGGSRTSVRKTKRNKRNQTKRNKRNKTKRNKRNKTKRNKTKRNKTNINKRKKSKSRRIR